MTAIHKKGTWKQCRKGHRFFKSSSCPVCPVCVAAKKTATGFLSGLSAPARRALEAIGIQNEKQLARFRESEILELHGMGPASLPVLRKALKNAGLSFKK